MAIRESVFFYYYTRRRENIYGQIITNKIKNNKSNKNWLTLGNDSTGNFKNTSKIYTFCK